jgi:hypothetical protein
LYRTRIGRSAIKKSTSTLAVGWWKSCLMYMDCKGNKIGVCVSVWNLCCFKLVGNKGRHCSLFLIHRSHKCLQ